MKKRLIILPYRPVLAALIFSLTIISCKKEKNNAPIAEEPPPVQVEESATNGSTAQPVITISGNTTVPPTKTQYNTIFDWENAQNMPGVAGQPLIPVPWSDRAVRYYDPGLRNDYKKSDGWEMVFNTFSDSVRFAGPVFMLYNKFRGVIRYYTYNDQAGNASVANYRSVVNALHVFGLPERNTHLLNFADQLVVDMNVKSLYASIVEPGPITQNAWYMSQFELAYDPGLSGYTSQQFVLDWVSNFASVVELSVNSKQVGSKMLYLQKPGTDFNDISTRGIAIGSNMQAHVKSATGLDELSGIFSSSVISNLKQTVFDSTAGNKLNATLVPQLGIADNKLDVSALIRLDYNMVGNIPGLSFAPPGRDNSKAQGVSPVFNEPMGIFYLGAAPVIQHFKVAGLLPEQYILDVASLEYIINPFIQTYADVRNFRQEIVAVASNTTTGLTEAHLFHGQLLKSSAPLNILGVRVSFDVVPKNGSAPIKMIKTFKADLRNS